MARVDFERAWYALAAHIASKPGHGARDLAVAMQRIAGECQVPEDLVDRVVRLYGRDLLGAHQLTHRGEDPPADPPGIAAAVKASSPAHTTTPGGHDGRHAHPQRA